MRLNIAFFSLILLTWSCSTEPGIIEYGYDHCNFCEMTIVDQSHASILVSTKGKSYKFDAIECMVRFENRSEDRKYAHRLVCDYSNPGTMILAEQANFLISQEIPSPMGGYLSAISDKKYCEELQETKGGEIFQWHEIMEKFQ